MGASDGGGGEGGIVVEVVNAAVTSEGTAVATGALGMFVVAWGGG